jgi:hypothetical protein
MFVETVLVYKRDGVWRAYERTLSRGVKLAVDTSELITTNHDEANRAAVSGSPAVSASSRPNPASRSHVVRVMRRG